VSVRPSVTAVDCGSLPAVLNASLPMNVQTTYLSDVTYWCLPGHFFHRDAFYKTVTCQADGSWSPANVKPCVRKSTKCITTQTVCSAGMWFANLLCRFNHKLVHRSSNRAWRRTTLLTETNALTAMNAKSLTTLTYYLINNARK